MCLSGQWQTGSVIRICFAVHFSNSSGAEITLGFDTLRRFSLLHYLKLLVQLLNF